MIITYQGENYFKLQNGNTVVLINPTNQRSFKGAVLILNTTMPAPAGEPTEEDKIISISHQGEYEIQDIQVRGWSLPTSQAGVKQEKGNEKTIYRLIFEDLKIIVLGDLDEPISGEVQNACQQPDIILGPNNDKINKWVKNLEPALILPAFDKPADWQNFAKEFGHADSKPEEKITLKKKDLTPGKIAVQWLKP